MGPLQIKYLVVGPQNPKPVPEQLKLSRRQTLVLNSGKGVPVSSSPWPWGRHRNNSAQEAKAQPTNITNKNTPLKDKHQQKT